jgi:integrase
LEEDFWLILDYFGRNFVEIKAKRPPHLLEYPGMMVQPGFHPVITGETRNPALPLKTF